MAFQVFIRIANMAEENSTGFSDQELLRINPQGKPLTVEALRSACGGLENLSDGEVQSLLFSIRTFCAILFEALKEARPAIDEQTNNQKLAA